MAQDIFLKIDGIPGESLDAKHAGEIQVLDWGFGVSQTGDFHVGSGGGAGKASFRDFQFDHRVDKSSPRLFLACASGEHIKSATLTVRKAGKEQHEYMKINFTDLLISNIQDGGSSSSPELPTQTVTIAFSKVEFEYRPQKADGSLDAAIKHGWDLKKNEKV
ncbi:Hcp family type VI secretion system effector [Massilia horti]|uniref:Type VI secretion system tube protein Hcp n=1 Tax=Massilia horti TaxID=2562153 RepID=A0A4Y9T3K2_9BURK|nr:type VI secretion system tube protein Hcp [Massilia horti]TFW33904.1 type VI secretion system tube protein Hcp [Massilia horti]